MPDKTSSGIHRLSAAGALLALGIIFGDIGTSPIYVLRVIMSMAIEGHHPVNDALVLGGLSCIFWTLTVVTSFKYVILTLEADNNGEGGIFALYALVRRYKAKWPVILALIGGASLIADGFLAPPISISSAVEGLTIIYPRLETVPIVLVILFLLFLVQQFGTKTFNMILGPVMLIWFAMIGALGAAQIFRDPSVLKALNPVYAFQLILNYPGGFWFLGAVFLCTTGAEALYSDLGRVGKQNIRVSWAFVKVMLLLCYFGQGAFILAHKGANWKLASPFYSIMPHWFLYTGIVIATVATIVASQALISGCFGLVNEAMKLRLWPNQRVIYPTKAEGQLYIPFINWFLYVGCTSVVLIFKVSGKMEAAYGLAIIINMLMTTTLLTYYFVVKRKPAWFTYAFAIFFFWLEITYLSSNLKKFPHGGWYAMLIASFIFVSMYLFYLGKKLRNNHLEFVEITDYLDDLQDIQNDETIPKEATNLVFMCQANDKRHIDSNIIYSIFRKKPKKADVYWFVHVDISNEPYGAGYYVETILPGKCFFIRLRFGYKVEHKVNIMFSKVLEDMEQRGEIDLLSNYPSLRKHGYPADFKFILLNSIVSVDNNLSPIQQFLIKTYNLIKGLSLATQEDFGLERTNCKVENIPIRIARKTHIHIKRAD